MAFCTHVQSGNYRQTGLIRLHARSNTYGG
jgi:hypothetical protein